MGRKIAPTLQRFFGGKRNPFRNPEEDAALRAELRALLAVARAARRVARDWDRWDEATPETCRAFHRALSRLDRASQGGK